MKLICLTLLCLGAAIAMPQDGGRSEPVSIIFDSKSIIVNPGESLSLDCGVVGDFRYCHWEKATSKRLQTIQVQDVHDGLLEGLRKPDVIKGNECGIVINSVTTEEHGSWKCKVFVVGNTHTGTKNVTVTTRPTYPVLEVPSDPLYVNEDDQQTVTCSVAAARPQVAINWYLGEDDVTYSSKTENSLTDDAGTYKSISTLQQVFKAWHNNKQLRCSVAHYTLDTPVEATVDINVSYKPWGKDVRLYGVKLGSDVDATLDFSSNPLPSQVKWGYGPNFEEIPAVLPVPGEEGRYSTEMLPLDNGHFAVILRILEFNPSDAQTNFKITVENDLGVRDFRITLSNAKPPNEPLSSGVLAAIVIVVSITLLVLLCCVYMRYQHLYCFAKKKPLTENSTESGPNNSDTESARSTNATAAANKVTFFGKLQKGLKRNKHAEKNGAVESPTTNGNGPEDVKAENGITNESAEVPTESDNTPPPPQTTVSSKQ